MADEVLGYIEETEDVAKKGEYCVSYVNSRH